MSDLPIAAVLEGEQLQKQLAVTERRLARERAARQQAENLLEKKSLELYERGQQLAAESAERVRVERLAAEAAVRSSEGQRFQQVVEAAPSSMIMVNNLGEITLVNAQTERLFGYERQELLGNAIEMLVPQRIRSGHPTLRNSFFSNPYARSMGVGRDLFGTTKAGMEVPIEIGLNPIETPEGLFVLASIIDITERKKAEKAMAEFNQNMAVQVEETTKALARVQETQNQLVQAEKMASLGGLVAGIAHEVNTPVGITVTAASHLQDKMKEVSERFMSGNLKKSEFQAFIEECLEAARIILGNSTRAADLIHSFKMIAVDQSSGDVRDIELQGYLKEMLLSLSPQIRKGHLNIKLQCPDNLHVKITPGGISQLVTNLVTNTVMHAYDGGLGGVLEIKVAVIDDWIEMRFQDYGKGMSKEVLSKIFDPFFTTKRGSGGSGLGMHIVYNLVEQTLGGSITVTSEPDHGSEFLIRFPARPKGTAAVGAKH